jgi:hypothetical protein
MDFTSVPEVQNVKKAVIVSNLKFQFNIRGYHSRYLPSLVRFFLEKKWVI